MGRSLVLFVPDVEVNVKNCQDHKLKALHVTIAFLISDLLSSFV